MEYIGEVKTHSPFGFHADESWEYLLQTARRYYDTVAIHTEDPWHGSIDLVRIARSTTTLPIMAKGLHKEDYQIEDALEAGADKVLTVRGPDNLPAKHLLKHCLIEPENFEQLKEMPPDLTVVWNARDLATGKPKPQSFDEAADVFTGVLYQASFIRTMSDISVRASGVIVGQYIEAVGRERLAYSGYSFQD